MGAGVCGQAGEGPEACCGGLDVVAALGSAGPRRRWSCWSGRGGPIRVRRTAGLRSGGGGAGRLGAQGVVPLAAPAVAVQGKAGHLLVADGGAGRVPAGVKLDMHA